MKPRPRTVFGRRTFEHDGHQYRVEMRREGIVVHPKYGRRVFTLSFTEIATLAQGQRLLPLK